MKSLFLIFCFIIFISACGQSNYELANTAYMAGDYEKAFRGFTFLANDGDAKAQYYIGFMHENGLHINQDFQEAAKWYKKSAKKGYPNSQIRLAQLYIQGAGVERDY